MAVFHNNPILKKARGMVGGLVVFRQVRGRTIMQMRPKRPTSQSLQQKSNREQFAAAAAYAREATRDPEMKKHFANEAKRMDLPNAYTAALTLKQREWKEQSRVERQTQIPAPEVKVTPVTHSLTEQRSQVAGVGHKELKIDINRDLTNQKSMIQLIQSAFTDLQQSISNMNQLLISSSPNGDNEAIVLIDKVKSQMERIDPGPLNEASILNDGVVDNKAAKDQSG